MQILGPSFPPPKFVSQWQSAQRTIVPGLSAYDPRQTLGFHHRGFDKKGTGGGIERLISMARRRRNTIDLATGLGLASLHTGITLFYRLPMLAASFSVSGKERHARELNRMVGEKTSAMFDGVLDANKEFMRLSADTIMRPFDLAAMTQNSASIVDAALRPAFRRVKANSRRLNKSR